MEISLRNLFQDFNHSKVLIFSSLLVFLILFALKEDKSIAWPYWAIFIPLWIWKFVALAGGFVGCLIYNTYSPNRHDMSSRFEYRSMILSWLQHALLLSFEILLCYKLSSNDKILWLLVFSPLLFECLLAIPICIWSLKRDKNYEFEMIFGVNILQFVFIALKLDDMVSWPWVIIFVPLWILICLSLIIVLYAVVSAVLLIRSIDLLPEHRRQSIYSAVNHTLLVIPILIFLVLLTNKMDGDSHLPYLMVFTPLHISLICLLVMACGTKGGNQWWFGIRRDFCEFLLSVCPLLREYGNVSYRFGSVDHSSTNGSSASSMMASSSGAVGATSSPPDQSNSPPISLQHTAIQTTPMIGNNQQRLRPATAGTGGSVVGRSSRVAAAALGVATSKKPNDLDLRNVQQGTQNNKAGYGLVFPASLDSPD